MPSMENPYVNYNNERLSVVIQNFKFLSFPLDFINVLKTNLHIAAKFF